MTAIRNPTPPPSQMKVLRALNGERWYALTRTSVSAGLILYFASLAGLRVIPSSLAAIGAGLCAFHLSLSAACLLLPDVPSSRVVRRHFFVVIDQVCLAATIGATEVAGLPLVALMLWGAIDAGYRFGIRFLVIATIAGQLTLVTAAGASLYWREHVFAVTALAFTMLAVPALAGYLMVHVPRTRNRLEYCVQESQRIITLVANDLRNPLHALSGHLDLASRSNDLDEVLSHLHAIRQARDTLSSIADNALIYQALQENSLEQQIEQVDLAQLVRSIRDDLSGAAKDRQLRINVHEHPNAPWLIEADGRCMRLILRNIVEYAIAAGSQGTVEIVLQGSQGEENPADPTLRVTVSYDGPLLSATARETMFEVYGFDGSAAGGQPPATGLNLFNARRLVQSMGGKLEYSRTRQSAQLIVAVPVRINSTVNERPAKATGQETVIRFDDVYVRHRARVRPQRVLIAEVQRSQQQLLLAILEKAGHATKLVGNGTDALSQLAASPFDLALIDLRLPGTSGLDVIRLAKFSIGDRKVRTRFIVVTGDHSERTRRLCLAAGAMAYLTKPVTPQAVLETLARVLDEHDPERLRRLGDQAASIGGVGNSCFPPKLLVDSLRDAMRYQELAMAAGRARNWRDLIDAVRAIRGAVDSLGAEHVIAACTAILSEHPVNLDAVWLRELEGINHLLTDVSNALALLYSTDSDRG